MHLQVAVADARAAVMRLRHKAERRHHEAEMRGKAQRTGRDLCFRACWLWRLIPDIPCHFFHRLLPCIVSVGHGFDNPRQECPPII